MPTGPSTAASSSLEDVVPLGKYVLNHPLKILVIDRYSCSHRHECKYLHRLPLPTHQIPDTSLDCFAREKHADYRDDMGGVGSFGRQNRTLYIGRMTEAGSKEDTEEMVRRHFSEWGDIVRSKLSCGSFQTLWTPADPTRDLCSQHLVQSRSGFRLVFQRGTSPVRQGSHVQPESRRR